MKRVFLAALCMVIEHIQLLYIHLLIFLFAHVCFIHENGLFSTVK